MGTFRKVYDRPLIFTMIVLENFGKNLEAKPTIIVSIGENVVFIVMIIKPQTHSSTQELIRRFYERLQQLQ